MIISISKTTFPRLSGNLPLRKVQALTGKSINQFICKIRLRRAMILMQQEGYTASEVSFKTGFSSPAYFSNCFHDFYGYSPGEVKKMRVDSPEEHNRMASPEISGPAKESGQDRGKKPERKKLTRRLLFTAATGFLVVLLFLLFVIIKPYKPKARN